MKPLKLFLDLVRNQFEYGGVKYALTDKKESTDMLFDDFGKNWLFGTLAKYCKRYGNLARERDLLKIACYCFILWLKRGFHINELGTKEIIDTTVDIKSKYFGLFKERIMKFMIISYWHDRPGGQEIDVIYAGLKYFSEINFDKITEGQLFVLFANAYKVWNRDTKNKGQDKDTWNEKRN